MQLSARNQLKGTIKDIKKGTVTTVVKIEVKNPAVITASITNEAAEALHLNVGDAVVGIIKSSEIIVGKE